MSRINTPGTVVVAPTNNIYTALAAISFLASLAALVYLAIRCRELGVL
jgi:hypothetical protein